MTPARRRFLTLLFGLWLTAAAAEAQQQGAEICRFPAGEGDAIQRWFTSQTLTCSDITTTPLPERGRWNVFTRSRDAVSNTIAIEGAALPSAESMPLTAAAFVRAELPANTTGFVYVPHRASGYPLVERTAVPAGEDLWLLVLSKNVPIGVTPVSPLEAGSERTVDVRPSAPGFSAVGSLQLPVEERSAAVTAKGLAVPKIRLAALGKEFVAASLPPPELLDGALVLFGGPVSGEGSVEVSGRGWIPSRHKVKIEGGRLNVLETPIVLHGSSTVIVNWSVASDLAELDASLGSCQPVTGPPKLELTISSCASPQRGEAVETNSCQPIRQVQLPVDRTNGSEAVQELRPGFYRAELRFGRLPAVAATVQVAPFRILAIPVSAYYLKAYGSVTHGGKALGEDARLTFPTGIGFVSRDSDEYHAVLTAPFEADAQIDVVTCRGELFKVLADRRFMRNSRFDVEIPGNVLSISVIDTFTRLPVDSAKLQFVAMSLSMPRRPVLTMQKTAKAEPGTNGGSTGFVIKSVPERELRLQVSSPGYEKKAIDPFSMTKSESKSLEVQLVPLNGTRGKLLSSRPFERATIFWFPSSGPPSEEVDVEADGSFFYDARLHGRNETMVVVSESHPLWVSRAPLFDRRAPIEIRFPDEAPVRRAEVVVAGNPPRTMTPIGITIGSLRVPARAFALHMQLRGSEPFVRGSIPLQVEALAATGPIEILRGATVSALPSFAGSPAAVDFVPKATRRLEAPRMVFD